MSHSAIEQLHLFEKQVQARDRHLTFCYLAGIGLATFFILLPYQLTRLGGSLIVLALAYMICKVHQSRSHIGKPSVDPLDLQLDRVSTRIALARSTFYTLPFLVGANLVFMGLPVGRTPLEEASLDCAFLALSVGACLFGYWFNQRAIQRELQPLQSELCRQPRLASDERQHL